MEAVARAAEAPSQPLTFEVLYAGHLDFVWRAIRRLGVPLDSVDDAVQEVFVAVHRRLPEYEARAKVTTWLFSICLRVASDARRRRRRKPDAEQLSPTLVDPQQSPEDRAAASDALRQLDAVLEELDDDKRAVFVMAEVEQMTAPEMAEALGANVNTVYSRLRAARLEFEQVLARHRARQR